MVENGVVIAVVGRGGDIEALWNDDQKGLAIGWARFLVGRGRRVAVVDAATLDVTAVEKRLTLRAELGKLLGEGGANAIAPAVKLQNDRKQAPGSSAPTPWRSPG